MNFATHSIFEVLGRAPLLIGDLPEAACLDRSLLGHADPSYVLNFDQKLGHLYEDALQHLINQSDVLNCLASGLQVFDADSRTLGELDFVLYDQAQKCHIHLELAVKFYLGVNVAGEWSFPGPDPRDNWSRKLARMRMHQLPLSRTSEAQALLFERFGIKQIEVQQLVYGRLFLSMHCEDKVQLEAMAPDVRRGHWLYLRDWAEYFSEEIEVALIPKPLWPIELTDSNRKLFKPASVDMLKALAAERCVLFATPDSREPIFLVPDDWLNLNNDVG